MNKPDLVWKKNRKSKVEPVRRISDRGFTMLLVAAMIVGIGLLLYPSLSDYWNSFHQSRAVMSYAEHVSDMNAEEYDRLFSEARIYNERFAEGGIEWHMT
jgi:sortase A